jgi:hypothetical protein
MNELRTAAQAFSLAVQSGKASILGTLRAASTQVGAAQDLAAVRSALVIANADMAVASALARASVSASKERAGQLVQAAQERVAGVARAVAALPGAALDAVRDGVRKQVEEIEQAAQRTLRVAGDVGTQIKDDAVSISLISGAVLIVVFVVGGPVLKYILGVRS